MPLRRCETNASEEGKIGDEMQVQTGRSAAAGVSRTWAKEAKELRIPAPVTRGIDSD